MNSKLSLAIGMLLLGCYSVVNKQIVAEVPVFIASEIRLILGAILLWALVAIRGKKNTKPDKADAQIIVLQAVFGVFLFSIFALEGLKRTSAIDSGIIMGATPVAVLFLAFVILKKRFGGLSILAGVLACAGAIVLGLGSAKLGGSSSLLGNFLVTFAMFGEAIYVSAGKFTRKPVDPIVLSAVLASVGALLFLPFSFSAFQYWNISGVSNSTWGLLAFTGIGITVFGNALMSYGVSKNSVATTAVMSALMPVSSSLAAVIFLGETMTLYRFAGLGLVLAALYLGSRPDEAAKEAFGQVSA